MHIHTSHGMGCMHVNDTVHTVRLRFDEKNAIALRKIAPCERTFRYTQIPSSKTFDWVFFVDRKIVDSLKLVQLLLNTLSGA